MDRTTTDAWGITDGYEDAHGVWRSISETTRRALLAAMGVDPSHPASTPESPGVVVVRERRPGPRVGPGELVLEDGRTLAVDGSLPSEVPPGYHRLRRRDGRSVSVIVTPGRCAPPPRGQWGWVVQVYAARSSGSWGIGDFDDLQRLATWARGQGASVLVVNPLHAAVPRPVEDPSPYAPSSRRYRNLLYLRIEDVPGASALGTELDRLQAQGRELNDRRRIDRDAVRGLKQAALEQCWRRFGGHPELDRYLRAEGRSLEQFAVFSALAEHHQRPWHEWPAEHRHPDQPGVAHFAQARRERVAFHQWVQWLLDRQLQAAARELPLVHDFPIGVDPDGADAWAWQDVLARGASVGAPPDRYNRRGQDWGLPPFVPYRLRAHGYAPLLETLRAALRYGGGLRIDHVMGLFRLFWVPHGLEPAQGGYVRYPADELLAILALESQRSGAFVIGEDLGTVETGVRERLAESGILSTRVLWFESGRPETWPELALAAVTTHDLPTLAGLWTGSDLAAQERLELQPNVEAIAENRRRVAALAGVPETASTEAVVAATYRALARAPSAIVTATLEDAVAVEERPNMPGTTAAAWPNWSLALPVPLEALEEAPLSRAIGTALSGRTGPVTDQWRPARAADAAASPAPRPARRSPRSRPSRPPRA